MVAGSRIVSTYLGISETERILAVLPFSFDAGMNQLMTAFEKGGTLVLINFVFAQRNRSGTCQRNASPDLRAYPRFGACLPSRTPLSANSPCTHLRYITNTGGAMPQAVLKVLAPDAAHHQSVSDVRPDRSFSVNLSSPGRTRSAAQLQWAKPFLTPRFWC